MSVGEPPAKLARTGASDSHDTSTIGIAFDIDGVLKFGGRWDPSGAVAIQRVIDAKVPHVFMTNGGGGRTEKEYAAEITKKLTQARKDAEAEGLFPPGSSSTQMDVDESRVLLSYTPWNEDLAHLKHEPILTVGMPKEGIDNVMRSYGFEKAMHVQDYVARHPLMDPFKGSSTAPSADVPLSQEIPLSQDYPLSQDLTWPSRENKESEKWDEGFKAICVLTDPSDFFQACQVVVDVLLSSRPGEIEYEPDHMIPIYFSNPDFLSKFQYPWVRYAQGAFRIVARALYVARLHSLGVDESAVQRRLRMWIQYGKPTVAQYRFVLRCMQAQAEATGVGRIRHYYMIGDNPTSDMQGCVNMNRDSEEMTRWAEALISPSEKAARAAPSSLPPWTGVLVRTGVYKDGDETNRASVIVDGVADAVDWILKHARTT